MNNDLIKMQIEFMCKNYGIPFDYDFIDYVYNLHLKEFTGEKLKELREQYEIVKGGE